MTKQKIITHRWSDISSFSYKTAHFYKAYFLGTNFVLSNCTVKVLINFNETTQNLKQLLGIKVEIQMGNFWRVWSFFFF